jgi:RimJ/RimL family protein N-acetyltransferase
MVRAALHGRPALASALSALVPDGWPPEFMDEPALAFTLDRLAEGPAQAGWWLHFVVLRRDDTERTLIGSGGYRGPPTTDGTVEVGYAIVPEHQRQGYASETVRGLLRHAFAAPQVNRVIAETLPALTASIGVMRKCGFRPCDSSSEPGVLRFELTRAMYAADAAEQPPDS